MAHISKYKLKPQTYDKLFQLFFEVMTSSRSRGDFNKLMNDLLSPVERIMIAKRIVLVYLLIKEIDYRIICRTLKVSSTTVAKFKLLIERSEGLVPLLSRTVRNDKIKLFMIDLINDLMPPGQYGTNWSSAWHRRRIVRRMKDEGI